MGEQHNANYLGGIIRHWGKDEVWASGLAGLSSSNLAVETRRSGYQINLVVAVMYFCRSSRVYLH
jgi:hypothetical protein